MITIKEIKPQDKRLFKKFVNFPNTLYKGNPHYVPPFYADELNLINAKKNVAYDECDFKYFLAYRDEKIVGRVAAILQHSANEKWGWKNMRFSRFDFVNDVEVVRALLTAVEDFAKEKDMVHVHGPFGINDMDREGMLTRGFDRNSTFVTNYNFDYYPELVKQCGYEPEYLWNEYLIQIPEVLPEKILRVCDIAEKKFGLKAVEGLKLGKFLDRYATQIFDLYDETYSQLAGTMPLTEKMRRQMLSQFKIIINIDFLPIVVNEDDEVVAFGLAFPSIGDFIKKSGGRLTLPAICKMLKQVRKPKSVEFAIVGAKPGYDRKGATAVIMKKMHKSLIEHNIRLVESNPELETNFKVQSLWSSFEREQHKDRATFSKDIDGGESTVKQEYMDSVERLVEQTISAADSAE